MAADIPTPGNGSNGNGHKYHAEAVALHGNLERPLDQVVPPQSYLKLKEDGGYLSLDSDRYRLEGLISYSAAYTQVAGTEEVRKADHGYVTLATAVVENFNLLEVVTADRIVAQVSTEHPTDGHVPRITFLGSRFENLRIAGQRIEVPIDPYVLWDEDTALERRQRDIKRKEKIAGIHNPDLERFDSPEDLRVDLPDSYPRREWHKDAEKGRHEFFHTSLAGESEQDRNKWLPLFHKHREHHVYEVPHFGKIYLGLICIEQLEFVNDVPLQTRVKLTMLKAKLGCTGTGTVNGVTCKTNGITS